MQYVCPKAQNHHCFLGALTFKGRATQEEKSVFEEHCKNYYLVHFYLPVNWNILEAIYIVLYI